MNAGELLRHYERIADAPDAATRLRRFVLDLAVRGKLAPPEPSDEPADSVLEQLLSERERRIAAGEFREPSSVGRIEREKLPFSPPAHWRWARLIDLAQPSYGFAFASGQFNASKRGMPLIRIRDISATDTEAYFDGPFDPSYLVNAGDYLVGMDGDFNLRRWRGKPGLLNQRVLRINGWRCGVSPEFVKLPLQFILDHLHAQTSQTTVKHLSAKQVNGIEIPLPPVAEQHRIVAKVDELMALCDRLEAGRAGREETRDRLAAASLARLNTPDSETFADDACFVLDVLPELTVRLEHIRAIRKTILGLAVVGQLTDGGVDGASAEDELKLVAARKLDNSLKKKKSIPPVSPEETWCDLPNGWAWARWDQVSDWITYGFTRPMPHLPSGIPIVTGKNVNLGRIIFESAHQTSPQAFSQLSEKDRPQRGDILITKDGSIGRTAIVDTDSPFCINQSVAVMWLRSCHFDRRYLQLALDCPQTQRDFQLKTAGVAIKHISVVDLGLMVFPLPPLSLQQRIVDKVDQLMALCDQLESSISASAEYRSRLLQALLVRALDSDGAIDKLVGAAEAIAA